MSEKFSLVRELPLAGVSSIQLVDIDGDGREEPRAAAAEDDHVVHDTVAYDPVGHHNM